MFGSSIQHFLEAPKATGCCLRTSGLRHVNLDDSGREQWACCPSSSAQNQGRVDSGGLSPFSSMKIYEGTTWGYLGRIQFLDHQT